MMRNLKYTAAFAAAVLFAVLPTACTDDPTEPAEPTPQSGAQPICWNVKGVESPSNATRVMIGDGKTNGTGGTTTRPTNPADPDYYVTLSEACSVPASGSREERFAIGLFGDYSYTENGKTVTVKDFYRGDRLVYLPNEPQPEGGPFKGWDTNSTMKYWHPGAIYVFSAYYPQRLYNYTISNSTATTLALVYPSRKLQYDLLLGTTRVKATDVERDKDGNVIYENGTAKPGQMHRPVEIDMKHALAALRFQFKLNFDDADFLTSVYLLNDEERHFFTQGTIVFGKPFDENESDEQILEKLQHMEWKQDYNPPASEILYKWVPPLKYWYGEGEDKNNDGILDDKDNDGKLDMDDFVEKSANDMLKYWGWGLPTSETPTHDPADNPVLMISQKGNATPLADGDATGTLYTGKIANAYYGTELYYDITNKKWVSRNPAAAGSKEIDEVHENETDEVAAEGTLYCRNSGWLLIPPQESYGALTLCFTTKKGGKTLYKVKLPVVTGSKVDALDENGNVLKDANGNAIQKDGWAAGYRYTYLVTISESNFAINVSIDPWNERKHSTEIIF